MTVFERIKEMNEKEFAEFIMCFADSDEMMETIGADTIYPGDWKCHKDCGIKKHMEYLNKDTQQDGVPCFGCLKHYLNSDCGVYDYYEKYAKEEGE